MKGKWKNKMVVKNCRVFKNISTHSSSNHKVIKRCSVSSVFPVWILGACFISTKVIFRFFTGESCITMWTKFMTVCLTVCVLDTTLAAFHNIGGILKIVEQFHPLCSVFSSNPLTHPEIENK